MLLSGVVLCWPGSLASAKSKKWSIQMNEEASLLYIQEYGYEMSWSCAKGCLGLPVEVVHKIR
jgi:hypothetical protein